MTKSADKPGSVVDSHSSGPRITPKAQATYPRARREASALAYLVLLPVEVAAFHPANTVSVPPYGGPLPVPTDSSLWPCSSLRTRKGYPSQAPIRTGVTRHRTLWSPDFPLPAERCRNTG